MIRFFIDQKYKLLAAIALLMGLSFVLAGHVYANDGDPTNDERLITFYDRGDKRVILTHASLVQDALRDADISIGSNDVVEPDLNHEMLATQQVINIYRARPVIIVDGAVRQKVMTAAQTPRNIIANAGIAELHDEDKTELTVSSDIAYDGAGTILTINRAIPFTLQLYGKPTQVYAHAATVGEMLEQKDIKLSPEDTVSVDKGAALTAGMTVAIWRNGAQTTTIEEPTAFPVRTILDADQPVGYRKVQTPGTTGLKSVTYEITALGGRETGRKIIQSVTLSMPKEQIEIMGAKPGPNALSKAKGAQYYTDSRGVSHRETYYDLNMGVVIGACGGGSYTVRADGAKVDKDGYILIAANYGNYPRCSVVETSMGLGKVYDTGGFAARHPHGFDLATDWSNPDGR
jgi:uncharacterized protein YabE (DUF348 family)